VGDHLEFVAEAEPGDFIYVPPYVPHQESTRVPICSCTACLRAAAKQGLVVNLDIEPRRCRRSFVGSMTYISKGRRQDRIARPEY